jgi:tetratricopeptide (TPR) repeat protein
MTQVFQRYSPPVFLLIAAILFFAFAVSAQPPAEEKDPVKLFQQGQDAHEKGDLKTALEFYNEALELAPEFPEAEFQKASALVLLNRLEEAEESFRRAIELRPYWTPPITSLGALLIKTGNFAEAEKLLGQAIKLDDQNFPAFAALTDLYIKTKTAPDKFKTLLAQLKILSSKMRPPVSVWTSRAIVERALGDNASAKASAARALAVDPKNLSALHERAEASLALGDFSAAQNDAELILKISPNLASGKLLVARAQAAGGNLDDALKTLDALDEKAKQSAEYLELKKAINSARSDSTDNLPELEKQLSQNPGSIDALARLCVASRRADPAKALDYCRRASEIEPANAGHAIGYAAALVQSKQFALAVQILRRVITAAPDNYTAHANLATALLELKSYPEAITEFEWLTEKKPDLVIGYYFLGLANDRSLKYLEAMAYYKKFLSLADPSYNKTQIEDVNLRLPGLAKEIEKLNKKSRN